MSRGGSRPQGPGRGGGQGRGGGPGGRRPGGGVEDLAAKLESLGGFSKDDKDNRTVHVLSNHYRVHGTTKPTPEVEGGQLPAKFTIHQFRIEFEDKDLAAIRRKFILKTCKESLFQGGPYLYDGGNELYCTKLFTTGTVELHPKMEHNGKMETHDLKITFTKTLTQTDPICLQIYNLIIKQCMLALKLTPVGDNFFDPAAVIKFPEHKIDLWPGYDASVKPCESGLLLCVDVVHKVIHTSDLYSTMKGLEGKHTRSKSQKPLQEFILDELKGVMVITPYNNQSYRIDNINMDKTPMSTFPLRTGEEITFDEYFKKRYHLDIQHKDQPLVESQVKERVNGKRISREVVLIPELCTLMGLSDEIRSNMTVMKALGTHLHLSPSARVERTNNFMKRLTTSPEVRTIMDQWGLTFESKLAPCIPAKVLPNEAINFANQKVFKSDEKNDWTRGIRDNQMLVSVPLHNWIVITGEREEKQALDFINTMIRVARPLGFHIKQPLAVESLRDVRGFNYVRKLEELTMGKYANLQLILCVLPTNGAELYNSIKKRLSKEIGVPSQCIVAKTLNKNMMSVATKVVIQVNTKLGGEPWKVSLPPELQLRSMTIGFDYTGKMQKTGVLVATINEEYTRYCSTTFGYRSPSEMNDKLKIGVDTCLRHYFKANDRLPDCVVFYRNNVDDGRISSGEIEMDAKFLETTLQEVWAKKNAGVVNLVYITLAKGSTTRLMSHTGTCDGDKAINHTQMVNPPPGTVVDRDITGADSKYKEFYIVPTVARQGTVRAVHYRVILDTKDLHPAILEMFTYKLCHLYYNWTGTVNLPSVIQYAGKLAKQATQCIPNAAPHVQLSCVLHFL